MAYAFLSQVEGAPGTTSNTSISSNTNLAPTIGNLLFFEVTYFSSGAKTVTWPTTWGTVTNTNTPAFNGTDGFGMAWGYVFATTNTSALATATFSAACDYTSIRVSEYSGVTNVSPLQIGTLLNRQVSPGTSSGAITASATLTGQPAMVLGTSVSLAVSNWDTAVNATGRSRVWDYNSAGNYSAKPQDTRRTATGGYSLTWTSNVGTDTFYSWITVFNEPGAGGSDTSLTVDSGALSLTGQDVSLIPSGSEVLAVTAAALTLSGQSVDLVAGSNVVIPITNAALSLSGQELPFTLEVPWTEALLNLIGSSVNLVAGVSYTITVDSGALTLAGQTINLLADEDYVLPVTNATLSLTGSDVSFVITGNTSLVVDSNMLSLIGSEIALNSSFTISGSGTGVRRKRNRGIRRLINIGR